MNGKVKPAMIWFAAIVIQQILHVIHWTEDLLLSDMSKVSKYDVI